MYAAIEAAKFDPTKAQNQKKHQSFRLS